MSCPDCERLREDVAGVIARLAQLEARLAPPPPAPADPRCIALGQVLRVRPAVCRVALDLLDHAPNFRSAHELAAPASAPSRRACVPATVSQCVSDLVGALGRKGCAPAVSSARGFGYRLEACGAEFLRGVLAEASGE